MEPEADVCPNEREIGSEAPPPFPNALCGVCGAHGRGGRATLPFPKEAVALKVKEIMMDSFFSIKSKFLLAMRAVGELSKFQPPISRGLRASMVAWALGLVLSGSPAGHEEAEDQGLWQEGEEGLHRMLLAFLREDPLGGNFFTLLDSYGARQEKWGSLSS
ncbi:UNVERIFIED_CONTAM: hypothetical protein K2H54_002425 [Gekko kuhli]